MTEDLQQMLKEIVDANRKSLTPCRYFMHATDDGWERCEDCRAAVDGGLALRDALERAEKIVYGAAG